uniref:THH1/TOM1/TOM3 domain-containing protein n=1 Tax=Peronospora matthiolae TaxID=2874970 RepID=A0AAV1V7T4_9STRA
MSAADVASETVYQVLSIADRLLLLVTIVLFLSLSAVSGRVLYRQYAAKRKRLNSLTPPSLDEVPGVTPSSKAPYSAVPPAQSAPVNVVGGCGSALMEEEGAAAASTGFEMRQRLFLLLFGASTLRVCSMVTEVATLEMVTDLPSTSVYCKLLALFLWLPSMLFVSMYGLVLLFWAQLCYACRGKAHPWPRRVFFLFNVLLYAGFVLLAVFASTVAGFWRGCDLLQGGIFFAGLFVILYYSIRLVDFFRNQSPDDDFFFDLSSAAMGNSDATAGRERRSPFSVKAISPRQLVLRRITAVCILLCVLFSVKAVYLIGMGTGYMESKEAQFRAPVGVRYIAFEFIIHISTEFIPSVLLLYFTRQDKHATSHQQRIRSSSATSASASLSGGSYGANNAREKPLTPNYAYAPIRGVASSHPHQEDAVLMLSGYQYQATQRGYGTTSSATTSSQLRSSNSSGAFLLESISGSAFGSAGPNTGAKAHSAYHNS